MSLNRYVLPIEEAQKLDYFPMLQQISTAMQELKGFPGGYCAVASRVVYEILGFEETAGLIGQPAIKIQHKHIFNHDRQNGLYPDLTLHQFSKSLPEISVMRRLPYGFSYFQAYTEEVRKEETSDGARQVIEKLERLVHAQSA